MKSFSEAILDKVLLFDGAMGTEINVWNHEQQIL